MADLLTQFHYQNSLIKDKFDFQNEKFDIRDIYSYYSLKVRYLNLLIYSKA